MTTDGSEDDENEPFIGEVPGPIFELAENCRRFALSSLGVELDYTAETLPILDEYLRMATEGVKDRPELEALVAESVAAYFGEVLRRYIDGFWRRRPEDPVDEWEMCARRTLLSMSPLGLVLESLARSEEHPGPSGELRMGPDDRELAEQRVAIMPPVSEEEYFLLSTRLEVIETIYETLRERMKADGRESLVFEPEDYDDQ